MRPHALLATLSLFIAAPALAQDASTAGALSLYPTWNAIGARLSYTGDANANATAKLEWRRQGDLTWIEGMSMTRITNSRWAASVLWLTIDTPYEVRATINDPDGGGSATASTRTRATPTTTPSGRQWWVATNGNDSNGGTSSAPLATLQAAANLAQPGDEIRVRPGVYYQTLDTPRSGTASARIHLVADGPGVRLDGADPAYLSRTDWQNDGGGIYSLPYTGTTRLVAVDSLMRLYHHANLAAIQSSAYGITQGWAVENGRLYVKLEGAVSPVGHSVYVARYNNGIMVDESYWRIDGLEIRHYSTAAGGGGIRLRGANGCVISNNHIHTNGGRGIYLNALASDNLIEHNLLRDPRIGTWPWNATKAHEEEIAGVSNRGGRGTVVRFNTVIGLFDGLDTGDGNTDENVAADCDFHDNLVTDVGDDAIETDISSGINLRLWNNRFNNCFSGISIAPIYQGPEYVVYNTVTNTVRGGFKFSLSGTGHAWICHNTVTSSISGSPAVHPSGPYSNLHFRNNILIGNGAAAVSDDSGESQTGNDFDGDLIFSNYGALFRWKNTNYATLAALRSATGFEINGRAGDPLFTSASSGNYQLLSGSPAIDGAMRLPGINDTFRGAAPDMGAFEFGQDVADVIAPGAITDLSVSPP